MTNNINKACDDLALKFNLSSAEKHILLLITNGHSPQEISEIRERSIETIRSQIKQIMAKVGVNRMNSIVMEVFRLAGTL